MTSLGGLSALSLALPLVAALLLAGSMVIDKFLLRVRGGHIRELAPIECVFLTVAAFLAVLLVPEAAIIWSPHLVWLLTLDILLAIIWNLAYYQALRHSSLGELELSVLAVPLLAPLFSWLLHPQMTGLTSLVLATLVAIIVIWAHLSATPLNTQHSLGTIKPRGLNTKALRWQPAHAILLIGWAAETLLWAPITALVPAPLFYLLRIGAVSLVLLFLFKPRLQELTTRRLWWPLLLSGLAGGTAMILLLTAVHSSGLVASLAGLAVAPLLVLVAERRLLHERLPKRLVVATFLVLSVALLAQLTALR